VFAVALVHAHRAQSPLQCWPASPKINGYPGGNGYIPFENGMLSKSCCRTATTPTPLASCTSHRRKPRRRPARTTGGRWGRGFERYYGFLGGDTHQYYPELVRDNSQIEPPKTPEEVTTSRPTL
jgi:arylsulfatase